MNFSKTQLLTSFVITFAVIVLMMWIHYKKSNTKENFESSEVKENVSRLFDLKEKKKNFLNSITKLNKELTSLKEYYSNIEKIDETD
jgi:hypothetical protein